MPYKHSQLKGLTENSKNDPNMLCSSLLAIVSRLFFCRQSIRNKTQEKKYFRNKVHQVKNVR